MKPAMAAAALVALLVVMGIVAGLNTSDGDEVTDEADELGLTTSLCELMPVQTLTDGFGLEMDTVDDQPGHCSSSFVVNGDDAELLVWGQAWIVQLRSSEIASASWQPSEDMTELDLGTGERYAEGERIEEEGPFEGEPLVIAIADRGRFRFGNWGRNRATVRLAMNEIEAKLLAALTLAESAPADDVPSAPPPPVRHGSDG